MFLTQWEFRLLQVPCGVHLYLIGGNMKMTSSSRTSGTLSNFMAELKTIRVTP